VTYLSVDEQKYPEELRINMIKVRYGKARQNYPIP
jgi:hypothetical protein